MLFLFYSVARLSYDIGCIVFLYYIWLTTVVIHLGWLCYCNTAVQALSKALLDLRADMVSRAQAEVLVNAEQAAAEINVQKLVDKRTKELQVCCLPLVFIKLLTVIVTVIDGMCGRELPE